MGISKHHSGPMLLLSARSVKPVIKVYKIKLRLLYRHSLLFVTQRIPVQGPAGRRLCISMYDTVRG